MRPELKIVLVAVEIIVVIAAALALEQCGTGSENSDKGYISGEYSGGAQENIDYEAKTVAIDSGHGGISRIWPFFKKMLARVHSCPASLMESKKRLTSLGPESGCPLASLCKNPHGKLPFEKATLAKRAVDILNREE